MAKRKKRRSTRSKTKQEFPGWLWMLFGLAIGLSVAFAVYMRDEQRADTTIALANEPASLEAPLGVKSESPAPIEAEAEPKERRFTFYELLPNFVVEIPEQRLNVSADVEPEAVVEPGVYVLQAGAFSTEKDADRRRAELALHGIESKIQRVKINGKNYYRIYVGPTDDLNELNLLRSRLRAAKIDVFRIRLSD
jgi:cell division protein FtsN